MLLMWMELQRLQMQHKDNMEMLSTLPKLELESSELEESLDLDLEVSPAILHQRRKEMHDLAFARRKTRQLGRHHSSFFGQNSFCGCWNLTAAVLDLKKRVQFPKQSLPEHTVAPVERAQLQSLRDRCFHPEKKLTGGKGEEGLSGKKSSFSPVGLSLERTLETGEQDFRVSTRKGNNNLPIRN